MHFEITFVRHAFKRDIQQYAVRNCLTIWLIKADKGICTKVMKREYESDQFDFYNEEQVEKETLPDNIIEFIKNHYLN